MATRYFKGKLDDFRIWNRTLSASEVTQLYYLEKPGAVLTDHNFTTAIGLWFSDRNNTLATHGHISNWGVSAVTEMNGTFENRQSFDSDISGWDVSSVTDMSDMFNNARSFNQDVGDWNVSNVTDMSYMFNNASVFNQGVGRWDVSSVTDMSDMFSDASSFNRDIGDWSVSAVTDMEWMFEEASAFNQDIGDWGVNNVTDMGDMFDSQLLQPGYWQVGRLGRYRHERHVRRSHGLQSGHRRLEREQRHRHELHVRHERHAATSFNQDIGDWNVSNVTDMGDMFENASSFDQNLSRWDVSAVTDMGDMFDGADSLSNYHKGLIHASFSSNSNWPYDWSAFVGTPPPADPVTDDNDNPPPGGNGDDPVEPSEPSPPPTDPPVLTHAYRPIVRTESPGPSTDAQPLFEGRILTDGGSPILEAGFIVSRNINLQPGFHLIVQPGSGSMSSSNRPARPARAGQALYFRAYALNAVGESIGQIRKFRAPEASNAWWAQMPSAGGGWHTSDWFGTFRRQSDSEWVYHARLGWAYAVTDGQQGLWLWMMDEGWLWTQPGTHPTSSGTARAAGSTDGSEAGKPVFSTSPWLFPLGGTGVSRTAPTSLEIDSFHPFLDKRTAKQGDHKPLKINEYLRESSMNAVKMPFALLSASPSVPASRKALPAMKGTEASSLPSTGPLRGILSSSPPLPNTPDTRYQRQSPSHQGSEQPDGNIVGPLHLRKVSLRQQPLDRCSCKELQVDSPTHPMERASTSTGPPVVGTVTLPARSKGQRQRSPTLVILQSTIREKNRLRAARSWIGLLHIGGNLF